MKQITSIGESASIYISGSNISNQVRDKNDCKDDKITQKDKIWDCYDFY